MYGSLIDALLGAPRIIHEQFALLGKDVSSRADSGKWSAEEIFEHVRASDSIIAPRIYHVLLRPGTLLPAVDERAWAELLRSIVPPLKDRLTAYTVLRQQLAGVLRSLSTDQWSLFGEHEVQGRMTIVDLSRKLVDHEAEHLAQIEEVCHSIIG